MQKHGFRNIVRNMEISLDKEYLPFSKCFNLDLALYSLSGESDQSKKEDGSKMRPVQFLYRISFAGTKGTPHFPRLQITNQRPIAVTGERVKVRVSKRRIMFVTTLTCVSGYVAFKGITQYLGDRLAEGNLKEGQLTNSLNSVVTLYRKLPWKAMSRTFGKMMSWELPLFMREPCIGYYCYKYGVNIQEAFDENLKNYRSMSEFFRRQLKPDVRVIDKEAPVVSPADGKVLHFGMVENGVVEQVKGVNYAIKAFLGPHPLSGSTSEHNPEDQDYHRKMNIKPGNRLYNCIVYLSPGDYHRFHSAADWTISHRRHFPGELLSVKPGYARWIQGLFNFNERVVYSGTWKHGYFSYTAVGATNVGSMKVYMDKDLETNIRKVPRDIVYLDKDFKMSDSGSVLVSKGEMLGEFNLGSTIVVMFEAPKDFEFTIEPGQVVKYGERLGTIPNKGK